jgi:hypothetical protein
LLAGWFDPLFILSGFSCVTSLAAITSAPRLACCLSGHAIALIFGVSCRTAVRLDRAASFRIKLLNPGRYLIGRFPSGLAECFTRLWMSAIPE